MPPEVPGPEPGPTPPAGPEPSKAPVSPPTPPAQPLVPVPAPTPTPPALPVEAPPTDEGLPKWIKDLRAEAADNRVKNKGLQDKLDALEREKLSEQDKLKLDFDKLQKTEIPALQAENRRLQVQVASAGLGFVDPDAAVALVDWGKIDGGTSIQDALSDLLARKPYLKKVDAPAGPQTPVTSASPANPPSQNAQPAYTKSQLATMTPAEYEAQRDDIFRATIAKRVDYSR